MSESAKRKGLIASITTVVLVGYVLIGYQFGLPPIPDWVFAALGGVGITVTASEINKLRPPAAEAQE